MRSDPVVVASIRSQNPAQMRLAQDNDVVHTITPDRSDQPFDKPILPRRGWRGRPVVPDAHSAQSAHNDAAIDPIPIADEVARRLIPRKSLGDLTRNPFGRRVYCDVDPDKVPAVIRAQDRPRRLNGHARHFPFASRHADKPFRGANRHCAKPAIEDQSWGSILVVGEPTIRTIPSTSYLQLAQSFPQRK